jgi:hypothetical protein
MTAEHEIDYEAIAQTAMRGIVRVVLQRVAKSGLPGAHHFYVAFDTRAPGVVISKRLRENPKYREEMTIVLQHRFRDLIVTDDRFEVKLTFDGIPERLVIPFTAVKVFFDPSVPYGLQFEDTDNARTDEADAEPLEPPTGELDSERTTPRAEPKRPAPRKPKADKTAETETTAVKPLLAPAAAKPAPRADDKPKNPAKPEPVSSGNDDTSGDQSNVEPASKIIRLDSFRKK